MERLEYAKINITDILTEFIEEYNLQSVTHNRWVYFEIIRGWYGLRQSGKFSNDLLRTRLNKAGYSEAATTPGLWKHTWCPIQFCLIVDYFGIEYVGGGTCPPPPQSPPRTLWNLRRLERREIFRYWPGMELFPHTQRSHLPPLNKSLHWKKP